MQFFDTAEGYGKELYYPGHNEEIVGRAVRGFRNEVVIATKLHIRPEAVEDCGSVYAAIRRHLERSLKNLQTDYVDLYYLHRINMEVDYLEVAHAMGRLIQEGLVREWGISAVDKAQLEAAHAVTPVGAVQNIYSMVERTSEKMSFLLRGKRDCFCAVLTCRQRTFIRKNYTGYGVRSGR